MIAHRHLARLLALAVVLTAAISVASAEGFEKVNDKKSPSIAGIWKACATAQEDACKAYECDKISADSCGWATLEQAQNQCGDWNSCAGFWYQSKEDDHYWAMDEKAVDTLRDDDDSGGYWLKE